MWRPPVHMTRAHTHKQAYTHTPTYHTSTYTRIHMHTRIHTHTSTHTRTHACVHHVERTWDIMEVTAVIYAGTHTQTPPCRVRSPAVPHMPSYTQAYYLLQYDPLTHNSRTCVIHIPSYTMSSHICMPSHTCLHTFLRACPTANAPNTQHSHGCKAHTHTHTHTQTHQGMELVGKFARVRARDTCIIPD